MRPTRAQLSGFLFAAIFLVVTACNTPTNASEAAPSTATSAPGSTTVIRATLVLSPSSTSEQLLPALPTKTTLPTITTTVSPSPSPTDPPAATTELDFFAVIAVPVAIVRTGPADVFEEVANLAGGLRVRLLGRDQSESWYLVDLRLGQSGWVWVGALEFDFDEEVRLMDIAPHLEIPTVTPTPAPQPRMNLYLTEAGKAVVELFDFPGGEDVWIYVYWPDGSLRGSTKGHVNYLGYVHEWIVSSWVPKEGLMTIVATSESGVTTQNSILIP